MSIFVHLVRGRESWRRWLRTLPLHPARPLIVKTLATSIAALVATSAIDTLVMHLGVETRAKDAPERSGPPSTAETAGTEIVAVLARLLSPATAHAGLITAEEIRDAAANMTEAAWREHARYLVKNNMVEDCTVRDVVVDESVNLPVALCDTKKGVLLVVPALYPSTELKKGQKYTATGLIAGVQVEIDRNDGVLVRLSLTSNIGTNEP